VILLDTHVLFITATAIWHRATLLTADQPILNWSGCLARWDGRH
jgi:hypothetical protein